MLYPVYDFNNKQIKIWLQHTKYSANEEIKHETTIK